MEEQSEKSNRKMDAEIGFDKAKLMVDDFQKWMDDARNHITNPTSNPPQDDIYTTQMFSFEVDKNELKNLSNQDRVVGMLCYDKLLHTLSVILVGLETTGKPSANNKPHQTWPVLQHRRDTVEGVDVDGPTYIKDHYLTP